MTTNRISQYLEQESEECCEETCDRCDIINEYIELISNSRSKEELHSHLSEFYDEVHQLGFVNALKKDVLEKMEFIDHIEGTCDCGCEVES